MHVHAPPEDCYTHRLHGLTALILGLIFLDFRIRLMFIECMTLGQACRICNPTRLFWIQSTSVASARKRGSTRSISAGPLGSPTTPQNVVLLVIAYPSARCNMLNNIISRTDITCRATVDVLFSRFRFYKLLFSLVCS